SRRDRDGRSDLPVCTESDGGQAYWKARIQHDFATRKLADPREEVVASMKSDQRTVLRAMPDGTGFVGPAWGAELEHHRILPDSRRRRRLIREHRPPVLSSRRETVKVHGGYTA